MGNLLPTCCLGEVILVSVLTDVSVRTAKPPKPGPACQIRQVDIWDEGLPGFGLRVSSTGKKSWILGVRLLRAGRRVFTRIVLGSYPAMSLADAREKARAGKVLAAQHKDPREAIEKEKALRVEESLNTFSALVDEFLEKYVEKKGLRSTTQRDYRQTLKGQDVAHWQHRSIRSLTRADLHQVLDRIVARGAPTAANHFLAYVRKFFAWCVERGKVEAAPTDRVSRPAPLKARDRALSAEEIREVWTALDWRDPEKPPQTGTDIFVTIFKLLILTGQRREEVAGMRWDELKDLQGQAPAWEIPGERTKNRKPHIVPLSPQAAALLAAVPRIGSSRFVFTTTGKSHVSGFGKAKERWDEAIAKLRDKRGVDEPMPPFVIHDLRRTLSTRMHEELRVQPHIVEAVLNHISGHRAGVAGTYNRALYLDEKRVALTAWGDYVERLVKVDQAKEPGKAA